jgi:uncharacterized protein (TIGR02391 family)
LPLSIKKTSIELKADEILRQIDAKEVEILPRAGEISYRVETVFIESRYQTQTLAADLSDAISSYRIEGGKEYAESLVRVWERARANACLRWRDSRTPQKAGKNDTSKAQHPTLVELYDAIIVHPRIKKVSRKLFMDGHFPEAILNAYKAVSNMVKEKTGLDIDGKELMARAFNEQRPILKLTSMNRVSEIDEQEGFRFIFMGVMVGIRNPKAHDEITQYNPIRTLQYIALADLLARRIDESRVSALS